MNYLQNMTSMNESYFQDYSMSERQDEIIKFLWSLPDIGVANLDVNIYSNFRMIIFLVGERSGSCFR